MMFLIYFFAMAAFLPGHFYASIAGFLRHFSSPPFYYFRRQFIYFSLHFRHAVAHYRGLFLAISLPLHTL